MYRRFTMPILFCAAVLFVSAPAIAAPVALYGAFKDNGAGTTYTFAEVSTGDGHVTPLFDFTLSFSIGGMAFDPDTCKFVVVGGSSNGKIAEIDPETQTVTTNPITGLPAGETYVQAIEYYPTQPVGQRLIISFGPDNTGGDDRFASINSSGVVTPPGHYTGHTPFDLDGLAYSPATSEFIVADTNNTPFRIVTGIFPPPPIFGATWATPGNNGEYYDPACAATGRMYLSKRDTHNLWYIDPGTSSYVLVGPHMAPTSTAWAYGLAFGTLCDPCTHFDLGAAGWTSVDHNPNPPYNFTHVHGPAVNWSSAGGNICTSDGSGDWYWCAPGVYLGNQSAHCGEALCFDVKSDELNTNPNSPTILNVVVLQPLSGPAIAFTAQNVNPPILPNTWYTFTVPLVAGPTSRGFWHLLASPYTALTQPELCAALANVSTLDLLGEYGDGPDTGCLDNVCLGCPLPPNVGSICGTKFNDLNCDGVKDPGEPGLAGWTIIAIDQTTGAQTSVVTSSSPLGEYCFNNLPEGTYTMSEQSQTNWVQTQPKCSARVVTVGNSLNVTGIDFGNCSCPAQDLNDSVNSGTAAWQIISEPSPGNGTIPRLANPISPNSAWCQTCGGTWISVVPNGNDFVVAGGDYVYQYCFCLDSRFSNANLTLTCVLADNSGTVYLNGALIGNAVIFGGPCSPISTNNQSLFRPGVNCIQVLVHNNTSSGGFPTPSGVNIQGSVNATNGRCCFSTPCPCAKPPNGMVGWWPLDENPMTLARDLASAPNPGAPIGGPTPTLGLVGGALSFDGSNDYVEVQNHPELNFGTGNFSLDAWIKTTQISGTQMIVDKRIVPASDVVGYALFLNSGLLTFQIADGAGSSTCASCPTAASCTNYTSTASVATGNWEHVAVTVSRTTNGGTFYVNGVPVGVFNPDCHPGSITNTSPLRIGSRSSSITAVFNGSIDEVELFNRTLTPDAVYALYAAGSSGKCKERCYVKPYTYVCKNVPIAVISFVLYNDSTVPQSYLVTPEGQPSGSECVVNISGLAFSPSSASVTLAPLTSKVVTFTALNPFPPVPGLSACYCVNATNRSTGNTFGCCGKLKSTPRWLCPHGPTTEPLGFAVGQTHGVHLNVTNTELPAGNLAYRIVASENGSSTPTTVISLNGLAYDGVADGVLALPAPGGPDVPLDLDVTVGESAHFQVYDLVVSVDTDGGGDYEPLYSVGIAPRVAPRGDMDCDGVRDLFDVGPLVAALLDSDAYQTQFPNCDPYGADFNIDGSTDGLDIELFIQDLLNP